jgi:septum formation protein
VIELPVPVVLASASPTRRRLLAELIADFEVLPAELDEEDLASRAARSDARGLALVLARAKAAAVSAQRPDSLIIAADTLVACGDEVIGKPADREDAVRILTKLSRGCHRVVSALCVVTPDGRGREVCDETRIRLRRMSRQEIEEYVDRPGALDRAGVYALQPDDPNVEAMEGSASTVMGLPLEPLTGILRDLYPNSERR